MKGGNMDKEIELEHLTEKIRLLEKIRDLEKKVQEIEEIIKGFEKIRAKEVIYVPWTTTSANICSGNG
jgi:hypothetical protein